MIMSEKSRIQLNGLKVKISKGIVSAREASGKILVIFGIAKLDSNSKFSSVEIFSNTIFKVFPKDLKNYKQRIRFFVTFCFQVLEILSQKIY